MKHVVRILVIFLFASLCMRAQNSAEPVQQVKKDTIVLRNYDKHGHLAKTTTWVGNDFHFTKDYYDVGSTTPTYSDTLDAIQQDTVMVRKFDEMGRVSTESMEAAGDYVTWRSYYYDDSIWGYSDYNMRVKNAPYELREFYTDSTPRIIGTIKGKDQREGRYLTYYKNGNPQCICHYKNGKRDSAQRIYYENGNPKYSGMYSNGVQDGRITDYYENGKPESVYTIVNGTIEDTTYDYYENGQLWNMMIYHDGKPWEVISEFDENGKSRPIGTLKNGNGTMLNYNDDGTLYSTTYYKNGKRVKTVKAK